MPGAAVAASAIVVLLPLIPHNGSTRNDDNDDINKQARTTTAQGSAGIFLRGEQDGTEEDKNITKIGDALFARSSHRRAGSIEQGRLSHRGCGAQ